MELFELKVTIVRDFGRLWKTETGPDQMFLATCRKNVCVCYRMSDMKRLQWKVHPDNEIRHQGGDEETDDGGPSLVIKLHPMQIRTFALTVER